MLPTVITKSDGSKRLSWLLPNAGYADSLLRFFDEVGIFAVPAELKDGYVRVTVDYKLSQEPQVDFAIFLFKPWLAQAIALNKCLSPRIEPVRGPRRPSKPKRT
jgi:hypothetical protein